MPATSPASDLNDPPAELWEWVVTYRGEPVKGMQSVHVSVRVPRDFAHASIDEIAAVLLVRFGWIVRQRAGWSWSDSPADPDAVVTVSVHVREIREALAARVIQNR